jgi:hypothetical protein
MSATEIETLRRRVEQLEREARTPTTARAEFIAEQARADGAYQTLASEAPAPLSGERIGDYRMRLVTGLKRHSKRWSDVDLTGCPDTALTKIADEIYADAAGFPAWGPADFPSSVPP